MGPVCNTSRFEEEEYRNKSERIDGETQTARVYFSSDSQDPMAMAHKVAHIPRPHVKL